jgi:hypothetical protein
MKNIIPLNHGLIPSVSFVAERSDGDFELFATLNFDAMGITDPNVATQLAASVHLAIVGATASSGPGLPPNEIEIMEREDAVSVIDGDGADAIRRSLGRVVMAELTQLS